jgi:hypothetical protein
MDYILLRAAMAKGVFNKQKTLFTSKTFSSLRKKLARRCFWSIVLYGAEIWILWEVDQKYLENFEMWCWRRMGKISWTDRLKHKEVLQGENERTTYNEKKGG